MSMGWQYTIRDAWCVMFSMEVLSSTTTNSEKRLQSVDIPLINKYVRNCNVPRMNISYRLVLNHKRHEFYRILLQTTTLQPNLSAPPDTSNSCWQFLSLESKKDINLRYRNRWPTFQQLGFISLKRQSRSNLVEIVVQKVISRVHLRKIYAHRILIDSEKKRKRNQCRGGKEMEVTEKSSISATSWHHSHYEVTNSLPILSTRQSVSKLLTCLPLTSCLITQQIKPGQAAK